mmetsp:Transcript_62553/g.177657  ORF Transcript_62553/g.177657 Transcript_62553/m.177657 type:complete len:200 (+) Transcript_62553:346-945(+)
MSRRTRARTGLLENGTACGCSSQLAGSGRRLNLLCEEAGLSLEGALCRPAPGSCGTSAPSMTVGLLEKRGRMAVPSSLSASLLTAPTLVGEEARGVRGRSSIRAPVSTSVRRHDGLGRSASSQPGGLGSSGSSSCSRPLPGDGGRGAQHALSRGSVEALRIRLINSGFGSAAGASSSELLLLLRPSSHHSSGIGGDLLD